MTPSLLRKKHLSSSHLKEIFSQTDVSFWEKLSYEVQKRNLSYFGKTISLFSPLYVSDACQNHCLYCGFSKEHSFERKTLSLPQIRTKAHFLSQKGFKEILILSGEDPSCYGFHQLQETIHALGDSFATVGIEVYPLSQEEYQKLRETGCDSVTLYQETYHKEDYQFWHPKGPKSHFEYRLGALERAAQGGFRALQLGVLGGLSPSYFEDIIKLAEHMEYLHHQYPWIELGFSLPRLCSHPFQKFESIDDEKWIKAFLALKLIFPWANATLSTRESPALRKKMLPFGVTRLSAQVQTNVSSVPQFHIQDDSSLHKVCQMILELGWEPVMQNWQMPVTMESALCFA